MIFVFDMVENIVEKGENPVTSIFSFYFNVFKKGFYLGLLKVRFMWQRVEQNWLRKDKINEIENIV